MYSFDIDRTVIGLALLILALGIVVKIRSGNPNYLSRIYSVTTTPFNQTHKISNKTTYGFAERGNRVEQDLKTVFPPCCRLDAKLACSLEQSSEDYKRKRFEKPIPIDQHFNNVDHECVSPTGFTISEILQIGSFPDYAALSGFSLPEPCINFDIETAKSRPYRPFRWPYHQTMALSKLEPNFWLEIDNTYRERVSQRQELIAEHGTDLCQALPGSELALKELSEVVIQFLCARYPAQFSLSRQDGGGIFHNLILGVNTNLSKVDALDFLAANVPEDFVIMLRDPMTGKYRLRAGIICSAIGWNLGEKMDRPLSEIHEPVPDYAEKMEKSMDRWFAKMGTEAGIQRGSWSWERGEMLYWPPKAGPIPGFDDLNDKEDDDVIEGERDVHLRIDWQTLRRLPLTGAIVFNFKALFTPLPDLIREPFVPALALKILNEGKKHVLKYKGTHRTDRVVKKSLKRYAEKQVEIGIVPIDWEVSTLDESPFWKGWQECQ